MKINIFFIKTLKNENVHNVVKTLFVLALSNQLKNKFSIGSLKYKKNKWDYPNVFLSASHCKNNVVVAISLAPIGIDIEQIGNKLLNKSIFQRILTKNEAKKYPQYNNIDLLKLWTKKEAIFKMNGVKKFIPNKIDTLKFNTKTYFIGKNLICSISKKC